MIKRLMIILSIACLFSCKQNIPVNPPEPTYNFKSGILREDILPGNPGNIGLPVPVVSASNPISIQIKMLSDGQFYTLNKPESMNGGFIKSSIKPSQFYGAFLPPDADNTTKRAMELSLTSLVSDDLYNPVIFYAIYDNGNITYYVIIKE